MRPNTFPTPNEHVDLAMEMLTPEEYKVLNFAIRHTWGWHVDQKAISVTTFTHGYGPYRGVGMSRTTVLKCLSELSRLEFLVPVGKPDSDGQVWGVGLDPNIEALELRFNESKSKRQGIMSPVRAKRGKAKTAVYDTDQSMTQTDSGLSGRPTAVYDIDAIKDTPKDTSKDKKKKITTSAPAIANAGPVLNPDEKDVRYPFVEQRLSSVPFNGKTENPARAENLETGEADVTTPTPLPPSHPAPEMDTQPRDIVETPAKGKGKGKAQNASDYALGIALGKAWGIPPAKSEIALYIKQAKALLLDVPVEEFQMFCDWRKADAGDWAKNLNIGTLLGKGYVSKYLSVRDALKEKERKMREMEARLYEQYPEARPPAPGEVIEYAPKDEVLAMMAKITRQENVS